MDIPINKKAIVKCSDGKCYPCSVIVLITDVMDMFPKYGIQFTNARPETVLNKNAIVNMLSVSFGELK